jgi:hypothetical protein
MFGQLGVLVWFSVENYNYGVASSEFWCMGFTTSLGVKLLSLLFVSVVVMFRSSGLQCRLLRVALFLLCFGRARAIFCHGISFTITVAGKHCTVGSWASPKILNGSSLCFGWSQVVFGHSLHSILSICFLSSPLEVADCYVLVTLTVKIFKGYVSVVNLERARALCFFKDYSLIICCYFSVITF